MDTLEFQTYLKRTGRKSTAIEQILTYLSEYTAYFYSNYPHKTVDQTTPEALESYTSWLESETGDSASKALWALRYFFDFIQNQELSNLAGEMRAERIIRASEP